MMCVFVPKGKPAPKPRSGRLFRSLQKEHKPSGVSGWVKYNDLICNPYTHDLWVWYEDAPVEENNELGEVAP